MGNAVVAAHMTDQKNGLPFNYIQLLSFKGGQDLKGKKKRKKKKRVQHLFIK